MDAERLAMIGELVQQQNQNLLRLQQAVAFPSPAFLFFCPRGMMNFNYRLLSKIYQNIYQSDPFSSMVKNGLPLDPHLANTRMRRTPLYQRSRHR